MKGRETKNRKMSEKEEKCLRESVVVKRKEEGLKGLRELLTEEEGMGTVEVILIIVVLVGLVIVFKNQITQIVANLFNKISTQTGKI